MNLQSLIAHNGVTHQKSRPVTIPKPSSTETIPEKIEVNPQIAVPSSKNSSDKQLTNSSNETNTSKPIEALTIETPNTPDSANVTLFPGLGESIFALLIASPFLLLGLKKWLHR